MDTTGTMVTTRCSCMPRLLAQARPSWRRFQVGPDSFNLQSPFHGSREPGHAVLCPSLCSWDSSRSFALVEVLPYHSANKVTRHWIDIPLWLLDHGLEVVRVSFWHWMLILTEDAEEEPLWRQWRHETLKAGFYLGRESYRGIDVVMLVILSVVGE
jgi:hypothetical protein